MVRVLKVLFKWGRHGRIRPGRPWTFCTSRIPRFQKWLPDDLFFPEINWRSETIERDIWLGGTATIRLPSKR